ncbi:MAG: hypothetical protein ACKOFO_03705, partial [Gemmatimonadota bacterium]
MREVSIARNYAEALLTLATKAGAREAWGTVIEALGDAGASAARRSCAFCAAVTRGLSSTVRSVGTLTTASPSASTTVPQAS